MNPVNDNCLVLLLLNLQKTLALKIQIPSTAQLLKLRLDLHCCDQRHMDILRLNQESSRMPRPPRVYLRQRWAVIDEKALELIVKSAESADLGKAETVFAVF